MQVKFPFFRNTFWVPEADWPADVAGRRFVAVAHHLRRTAAVVVAFPAVFLRRHQNFGAISVLLLPRSVVKSAIFSVRVYWRCTAVTAHTEMYNY